MSLLDYNMDDVPELTVADVGEYLLTVVKAEMTDKDKNGNPFLIVTMNIDGSPNTPNVRHFIGLPGEGMSEDDKNSRLRRFDYFLKAFDIKLPIKSEEMVDCQGSAILSVEPARGDYPESNSIKRFVAPK